MSSPKTRTLSVGALARVEGEGGLKVKVRAGQVAGVELRIYEPPRFFEAMLRGRGHTEPPDITARICGICPVAYQMSACLAIENACGVTVDGQVAELRQLLYCGEWIGSHALHVYMLHAPDFLGYAGGVEMATDHRDLVERGLRLKKLGNALMAAVGGRAIHPVNVRIGGFYRAPTTGELGALVEPLRRALDDALATVAWVAGFDFPDFEVTGDLVALQHPGRYPIMAGQIASTGGIATPASGFDNYFAESQVPHSTALHAHLRTGAPYLVGPMARYSLNAASLSPLAHEAAQAAGLGPVCRNPFRSIVVRAVEIVETVVQALGIIEAYEEPAQGAVDVPARAGTGHGVTEAPRGMLYHRYRLAADGSIEAAQIIPPTSQNQAHIEQDLADFVQPRLESTQAALTHSCEQLIRSYDPCISCATHFLNLQVEEL